jgi:para-aminobenzoate synthetase/4-amino-4-deoxychorismate lyase
VDSTDELLQHKTTSRRLYDEEWTRLHTSLGVDEVLFINQRGELTEGSRTNLFLQRGRVLLTPPVSSGLLNGILRRTLLDAGRCEESVLTLDDLRTADGCFMGNSLRGLIAAYR